MNEKTKRVLIRLIGTPIILAIVFALLYLDHTTHGHMGLTTIILIFSVGGLWEFYSMCKLKGHNPAIVIGVICCILYYFECFTVVLPLTNWASISDIEKFLDCTGYRHYVSPYYRYYLSSYLLLLYLLAKLVFTRGKFNIVDASLTYVGFIYIGLLGFAYSFILLMHCYYGCSLAFRIFEDIALFILVTNFGSNIGSYCVGKLVGKRKLAPLVSPNKTWEGAIGGFLLGTILGTYILTQAFASYPLDLLNFLSLLTISILVTISSQIGDLIESAVKRWAGVKDSGKILELGGFLDMIDGFLISTPVAYYGFLILKLI